MAASEGGRSHGALDAALDIFRVRQYFNVIVRARDVATAVRSDARFLDTVRRGILPLPFDRQPAPRHIFGPLRSPAPPPLAGRVGVVATGGSGALASLIGRMPPRAPRAVQFRAAMALEKSSASAMGKRCNTA